MKLKYPKKDATKQPSDDIDWFNPFVHWSPVKNPSVIGKRKQLMWDWNAIIGSTFLPSVVFKKERIQRKCVCFFKRIPPDNVLVHDLSH